MATYHATTDSDKLCCHKKAAPVNSAKISLIIPVGPDDSSWNSLLEQIALFQAWFAEIWLITTSTDSADFECWTRRFSDSEIIHWVHTIIGRGHQLNTGARLAKGSWLWFLHADSRLSHDAISALSTALQSDHDSIYFFNLKFETDGPTATRLNEWGAWMRSHWLRLPFGDQGLCMSRETFERLGGFPENVPYGEDHLLVWQAHKQRIPLRAIPATITTSARKYRSDGWFRTTIRHLWRTAAQSLPQLVALLGSRLR